MKLPIKFSILNRYIFREALGYFLISLIAFTGILLTIRILKFANLIINKGVEISQIGMVFISLLPTFLEIAIPMAMLLGVMLAFARLSGDSELIVIRASGISLSKLVKAVAVFGILGTVISLYVSISLRPWGFQTLSQTLFEIARSKSTSGLSEGIFNELGKLTLYSDYIDYSTGDLKKVLIDDKRNEASRSLITAKSGVILSNPENRTITIFLRNGQIHEIVNEKYSITSFNTNSLVLAAEDLYNPDAQQGEKSSRELYMNEIKQQIKHLKKQIVLRNEPQPYTKQIADEIDSSLNDLPTKKIYSKITGLNLEKGRRYSMPFAVLALALLAMPLGVQPPRTQKTWGAGLSLTMGLLVFVVYYGFLSIGIAVAESGVLPVFIALWLPNFVVFFAALYAIKKISSEEWQSMTEMFEPLLNYMSKLILRAKSLVERAGVKI
ncbi:MAG: LPS export ABC transporter permease LptF [Bdellovibrionales bacterium]|nr:LPS export ABC transporter permease LptF [Bdellovibrionales bacterium]